MFNSSAVGVLEPKHYELYEQLLAQARATVLEEARELRRREEEHDAGLTGGQLEFVVDSGEQDEDGYTWWEVSSSSSARRAEAEDEPTGLVARDLVEFDIEAMRNEASEVDVADSAVVCFSEAIRSEYRQLVSVACGTTLSLGAFVHLPQWMFNSVAELSVMVCDLDLHGDHVHGTGGVNIMDVFARLPRHELPTWLADFLSPRSECDLSEQLLPGRLIGDGVFPVDGVGRVTSPYGMGGYCYLWVFQPQCWSLARQRFGCMPTLEQLLDAPLQWFVDESVLMNLPCDIAFNVLHVYAFGRGVGECFVFGDVLAGMLVSDLPGWLVPLVRGEHYGHQISVGPHTVVGMLSVGKVKTTLITGGGGMATCGSCGKIVDPEGHAEVCSARVAGKAKLRGVMELSRLGGSGDKASCNLCGKVVAVKKHHVLCGAKAASGERSAVSSEPRLALVGDAMHALDVRALVAILSGNETTLSIDVERYVSASAQRRYMEFKMPGLLGIGRNDHTWGTAFEVRYHGTFRRDYLNWFVRGYAHDGKSKSDVVEAIVKAYSGQITQVLLELKLE